MKWIATILLGVFVGGFAMNSFDYQATRSFRYVTFNGDSWSTDASGVRHYTLHSSEGDLKVPDVIADSSERLTAAKAVKLASDSFGCAFSAEIIGFRGDKTILDMRGPFDCP